MVVTRDTTGGAPRLDPLAPASPLSCSSGPAANEITCILPALSNSEKYTARSQDGKDTDRITLLVGP